MNFVTHIILDNWVLGELLSEAAQVRTHGAGLTPLPPQEAGVQHGEEERGHHNGMNQASLHKGNGLSTWDAETREATLSTFWVD